MPLKKPMEKKASAKTAKLATKSDTKNLKESREPAPAKAKTGKTKKTG